ncbi:MAG: PTS fructose IIA subunit family protein [Xanthomonadales bacterium]|nr:PTS fructose IIA subunit family protein [Xanthomonadales bacterium]
MTVALLLVTHDGLGQALLDVAEANLGPLGLPTGVLPVGQDADTDQLVARGAEMLDQLDQGDGVLILTDLYGATPSNLAHEFCRPCCQVVHGVNLAMLLRAHTYRDLALDELANKVVEGGHQAVFLGDQPGP